MTSATKLLLVDDEELLLKALRLPLGRHCEVACALTIDEALAELEKGTFDVVMSDFDLHDRMNGVEFLALISERFPLIRRVLHTGAIYNARATASFGAVQVCVEKPATLNQILAALG